MNPPSRIQVGARNYHVVRESKRLVEHDAVGLCVGRYAEIALHPDQDPQTLRETTLHEVLHAIFYDVDSGNVDHGRRGRTDRAAARAAAAGHVATEPAADGVPARGGRPLMRLIGLSGYARSGKDTVAQVLVDGHDFTRVAFADVLRTCLYALDPEVSEEGRIYQLRWLIDALGWEHVKGRFPAVRGLLQRLGTEVGRNILGENIWVDAALAGLDPDGSYVFSDCRFVNEATAVTSRGGEVWRVTRPGVGPANDHISEVGLDDWPFDVHIANDLTAADLADIVSWAVDGNV